MGDLGNIETPRRHIGGHQNLGLAGAERGQGAFALTLRLVAVNRRDLEPPLVQKLGQFFAAMLGATEDHGQFAGMFRQIFCQQRRLVALRDEMHALLDLLGGLARRVYRDPDRIGQIGVGQFRHQLRHCGREKQRLPFLRQDPGDQAQRMDEADVQHLVGLVQNQIGGLRQIDRASLDKVDQAAGRGDQHIDAARQPFHLDVDRGAADDAEAADRGALGIGVDIGGDLRCQFARRRQNQRAAGLGIGLLAEVDQPGQHGQPEGRRLAGAGLGQPQHVAPRHDRGNAPFLDRCRRDQPHRGDIGIDAVIDPHFGKGAAGQRIA